MGYYKKSPSFGLPVQLRYVFPFFSINFKKLFTFFFNCDIFNRAWGYSSVGRALASHVRGQGFDSPYLHHTQTKSNLTLFAFSFITFLQAEKKATENIELPYFLLLGYYIF